MCHLQDFPLTVKRVFNSCYPGSFLYFQHLVSCLREEKRHLRRLLHDSREKVTFSVAKATVRVASSRVEAAKAKLEDCLSVVKCIKRDDSNNPGIISLYTFRHL